jgi:hypothetical protein
MAERRRAWKAARLGQEVLKERALKLRVQELALC